MKIRENMWSKNEFSKHFPEIETWKIAYDIISFCREFFFLISYLLIIKYSCHEWTLIIRIFLLQGYIWSKNFELFKNVLELETRRNACYNISISPEYSTKWFLNFPLFGTPEAWSFSEKGDTPLKRWPRMSEIWNLFL